MKHFTDVLIEDIINDTPQMSKAPSYFIIYTYDNSFTGISNCVQGKLNAVKLFTEELFNFYTVGPDDLNVIYLVKAYLPMSSIRYINKIAHKDSEELSELDLGFIEDQLDMSEELWQDSGDGVLEVYQKYIDNYVDTSEYDVDPGDLLSEEDEEFFDYLKQEINNIVLGLNY